MATLSVATKANGVFVLPAVLAAAYLSMASDYKVTIEYEDVETLERGEILKLTTDGGDSATGGSVVPFLVNRTGFTHGPQQTQVGIKLPPLI